MGDVVTPVTAQGGGVRRCPFQTLGGTVQAVRAAGEGGNHG